MPTVAKETPKTHLLPCCSYLFAKSLLFTDKPSKQRITMTHMLHIYPVIFLLTKNFISKQEISKGLYTQVKVDKISNIICQPS